jgi:NYN domain
MNRFAILIDAGYLLAWGAHRQIGAPAPRHAVRCDYAGLVRAVAASCRALVSLEMLRTYWYDGAVDQVPTAEHEAIGRLEDVKVRLGRLVQRGQKGVDTLMVLDMTTLARERAVSTAFLMSGDDDLREGVLVAQQLGLRIGLLGLSASTAGLGGQAETLLREADLCMDVTSAVDPFFHHLDTDAYRAGLAFGQAWVAQALASSLSRMRELEGGQSRELPAPLTIQLRTAVRRGLGSTKALEPWRQREAERGFWDALAPAATASSAPA